MKTAHLIFAASLCFSVQALASDLPVSSIDRRFISGPPACARPLPSLAEMEDFLRGLSTTPPLVSTGIGGLAVQNENAVLAQAYRHLNSYKNAQAQPFKDFDHWLLFKDTDCHKALCAIEKVYGKERGILYLYTMAKYGVNLTHLGYDRVTPPENPDYLPLFESSFQTREWRLEELEPYLQAVQNLPEHLLPLPATRMTHAGIVHKKSPQVLSNAIIQFYRPIDEASDEQKERATFHELAHVVGASNSLDRTAGWVRLTGWTMENKKAVRNEKNSAVSEYARDDIFEDFAESMVFYRYEPKILRAISPERYDFLKTNVFEGQEFLSSEKCR